MSKTPKRPDCQKLDEFLDFQWRVETVEDDYLRVRRAMHTANNGTREVKLANCYRWIHYEIGNVIAGRFSTFVASHTADTPAIDSRPGRRDPLAYIAVKALIHLTTNDRRQAPSNWVDGFVSRVAATNDYLLITPLLLDANYPISMRLGWLKKWLSEKDDKSKFFMPVFDQQVQQMRRVPELNIMITLSIALAWGVADRATAALDAVATLHLTAWCESDFRSFWNSPAQGESVLEILAKHAPEVTPFWKLAVTLGLSPDETAAHLIDHFGGKSLQPMPLPSISSGPAT